MDPQATAATMAPTVTLDQCYLTMTISDKDGNQKLDSMEYVLFCNQLSRTALATTAVGKLEYDSLPSSLKDTYKNLSNGDSEGIDIQGSRPNSNSSNTQQSFLRQICFEVGQAIQEAMRPSSPSLPTSLPISEGPIIIDSSN
jgi:hypothetical protein